MPDVFCKEGFFHEKSSLVPFFAFRVLFNTYISGRMLKKKKGCFFPSVKYLNKISFSEYVSVFLMVLFGSRSWKLSPASEHYSESILSLGSIQTIRKDEMVKIQQYQHQQNNLSHSFLLWQRIALQHYPVRVLKRSEALFLASK